MTIYYPTPWLFLPKASFGFRVLSLPVCACVCLCVCVRQSWACPRDNSWPVQASITKFDQRCKTTWLRSLFFYIFFYLFIYFFFFFGGGGGGSTLTFKVKFNFKLRFYPILSVKFVRMIIHHLFNYARITEFGPELQNILLKIPIVLVSDHI